MTLSEEALFAASSFLMKFRNPPLKFRCLSSATPSPGRLPGLPVAPGPGPNSAASAAWYGVSPLPLTPGPTPGRWLGMRERGVKDRWCAAARNLAAAMAAAAAVCSVADLDGGSGADSVTVRLCSGADELGSWGGVFQSCCSFGASLRPWPFPNFGTIACAHCDTRYQAKFDGEHCNAMLR